MLQFMGLQRVRHDLETEKLSEAAKCVNSKEHGL